MKVNRRSFLAAVVGLFLVPTPAVTEIVGPISFMTKALARALKALGPTLSQTSGPTSREAIAEYRLWVASQTTRAHSRITF